MTDSGTGESAEDTPRRRSGYVPVPGGGIGWGADLGPLELVHAHVHGRSARMPVSLNFLMTPFVRGAKPFEEWDRAIGVTAEVGAVH